MFTLQKITKVLIVNLSVYFILFFLLGCQGFSVNYFSLAIAQCTQRMLQAMCDIFVQLIVLIVGMYCFIDVNATFLGRYSYDQ